MKRPNFLLRSTGTTKNVCLTPNKPSDGSVTRTSQTIQSGRKSESQAENLQKRQKKTELGENHTISINFWVLFSPQVLWESTPRSVGDFTPTFAFSDLLTLNQPLVAKTSKFNPRFLINPLQRHQLEKQHNGQTFKTDKQIKKSKMLSRR